VPGQALIFAAAVSLCGHSRSEALNDPIAKLQEGLHDGQLRLDYEPKQAYLRSIIDALGAPKLTEEIL
jgi:hypothetical protein